MNISVTLTDESTAGDPARSFTLDFLEEHVTAREILRRRIYQEVTEYNAQKPERFWGLVQPSGAERELNGYRVQGHRKLDWEQQYARATEAFERLGFIMLVDDRQIESLDQPVHLSLDQPTEITFLKLVPLVGG